MYSVVLMMALTSGGEVPALGHKSCCGGCYGGGYGGCFGGCSGSCHGGKHHRGHGCCGGCYGGCYGGGYAYGCCGGGHKHQRRGHGCCGGCYGGGYGYGCCGGYGAGFGSGCCGGGYGMGGYGIGCAGGVGGIGGVGGMGAPVVPGTVVPGTVVPGTGTQKAAPKKTSFEGSAPATLIVTLPAEARLSIDGEATTSTSTERVFVSPALEAGREYHYTLKAEFQKDGKTVKLSKDVAITAGQETRVNFDAETPAEVASR